ncbi:hypothetical protein TWF730_004490 [Orbilia blumenaviensis]|uniref:Jacalin-type lectin domain-containing protein n=1 Tax=Orbilia blumenaviensis TaxID=1796055 RepID=A0AAV9TYV1_9PEZI
MTSTGSTASSEFVTLKDPRSYTKTSSRNVPITIPKFSGPVTAQVVTNWLKRCDKVFRRLEISSSNVLDDEKKVEAAGDAIVQCPATEEIYEWWVSNSIELMDQTWEEFQDEVRNQALGHGWQLRLLREYYTLSQGGMTAKEYSEKSTKLSKLIGCIDGEKLKAEPFVQKCQLLFRARPEVLDVVLENHIKTYEAILNTKKEDILFWLQKYAGVEVQKVKVEVEDSTVAGTFLPDSFPVQYIVGPSDCDLAGLRPTISSVKRFSNLEYLLDFTAPKVTRVAVYHNSNSYLFGIALTYGTQGEKICPDERIATNASFTRRNLVLLANEHITSYKFEYAGLNSLVGAGGGFINFRITTSNDRQLGTPDANPATPGPKVVAPTGWAIVGFHGVLQDQGSYGLPIRGIGPIFARIPDAET